MTLILDIGSQDAELVMTNSVQNIGINIKDDSGVAIDPEALSIQICDLNGGIILYDTYSPAINRDPDPPRILNPAVGRYEFPLGLDNSSTSRNKPNKTTCRRDILVTWRAKQTASIAASIIIDPGTGPNSLLTWTAVTEGTPGNFISIEYIDPALPSQALSIVRSGAKIKVYLATDVGSVITTIANDIIAKLLVTDDAAEIVTATLPTGSDGTDLVDAVVETLLIDGVDGTEEENVCENVRIITPRMCSLVHKLRLLIDKAIKYVNPSGDPDDGCYLGYSPGQLVQFLEDGLHIINAYQPSGTFSFDTYPYSAYEFTLIESALMAGVMSQQMFAIDTDVPNWNDQGNAFVIQHQPQLASYLNWLSNRLDKMIPQLKLNFVSSGSLHIEAGPNYRLAALVSASPSGSLFRNMYFRST